MRMSPCSQIADHAAPGHPGVRRGPCGAIDSMGPLRAAGTVGGDGRRGSPAPTPHGLGADGPESVEAGALGPDTIQADAIQADAVEADARLADAVVAEPVGPGVRRDRPG